MKLERGPFRLSRSRRAAEEVPRDEPEEDQVPVHQALVNWGAWCVGRRTQGRAFSAEGAYVAPKANVYNPPEPSSKVDPLQAEEVNTALLAVPPIHREALHMRYYLGAPDAGICRRLEIQPRNYLRFMRDARGFVARVLLSRGIAL